METFNFLEPTGFFHWLFALAGIICLVGIRLIRSSRLSVRAWLFENLIATFWSLFFLSLVATLAREYYPAFTFSQAFIIGYVGAHLIFRLCKEEKKIYHLKKPHNG